ncbi:MAG: DUF2098 domain-containing protein [Methanomassiliicoccales archaeon]|jgi:hypothetical protein|nr:DUF2098 domain-containing protein [Methanomassiliicoccales archaeon]
MKVGDYAKYKNTGTVGKILDIKIEDEVTWALLDTYNLYYDITALEEAEPNEYRVVADKEKGVEEQLEELEKMKQTLEEVEKAISRITPSGT